MKKNFEKIIADRNAKNELIEKQIQAYNAEIGKLKAKMLEAVSSEDIDAYTAAGEEVARYELKIQGYKEIIKAMGRGYSDEEVAEAWNAEAKEFSDNFEKLLAKYEKKRAELFDIYYEMAKQRNEKLLVLNEMRKYYNHGKEKQVKRDDAIPGFASLKNVRDVRVYGMTIFDDLCKKRGIDITRFNCVTSGNSFDPDLFK